ncbi:NAD-dependent epimerase/dehydratase family protein [Lentilactobacillus kosonis]|uniref:Probable dyhydroflavanol-4-reductase n=1 Tax=Lentilactobacillus kosonis TaxID=2810561 RepID=A0A401FNV8_9LACO|nr:NAD-dependent epimerase/dehydratase family protein [Lentilactobacillus kosonis]GAY74033.1 probable dyhydroflavanol-4-reductase [Lentilactobacillus kosonis]
MTKIFVTGGTGFIGSAMTKELVEKGYIVNALTHSEKGAKKLTSWGANPILGSLEDDDLLTKQAKENDAILHLGMGMPSYGSTFADVMTLDEHVIILMGEAIKGTNKPLIVTHGTASMTPGQFFTENDEADAAFPQRSPRTSEVAARKLLAEDVNAYVVRMAPSVHGDGDDNHGFIPQRIEDAKKRGYAANYNGGENRWTAVHVLDASHLYVLALEYALNQGNSTSSTLTMKNN